MGSPTLRGSLAATGALTAVGSLVAASDVIDDYPFPAGQTIRYLLASGLFLVLARGRLPRLTAREALWLGALAATGLVLFNACVVGGVREGDPATVGVIIGCVPIVLAVAGPLLAGRRPLACEAAFSLLAVPVLGRLAVSTYACLFAVPMLAVWSLATDGFALQAPSNEEALAFAYLGLIVTCGGFLLWYTALGLLGVERAGLFSGVLPVSALVCSAAIGAAEITSGRLAGVAVVAVGVTLGMRAAPSPPPAPVEAAG
jgi:drug/metabolite transporter (DMT)-like permease